MQRRGAIVLIVAGVLFILSGCKANQPSPEASPQPSQPEPSSTETAPPPPPSQPQSDSRPLIVSFGDSLTAGYGTDPGQSYPDYLQADLDKLGYHYRVVNAGISGNTTKDGLERVNSIVAMKPEVVIVEFGGNDGLRGLRIEDSRANLDQIVSTLQASGTKIVLAGITLPPDYGRDYINQFNETYVLLAKKFRIPLLPFLLKGVFGVNGMMQRDQTHATAAGNQVVAKNLLPFVTPLLKK
jgi:acyl-CoA thioesterase-1